jgi:hypothetical protein
MAGSMAGAAGGAAGATGGTGGGMAGATAGAGGAAGATAGAGGTPPPPPPPVVTSSTAVIEVDNVIAALKGGSGSSDGGVDAGDGGGVDAGSDGGVDGGAADAPVSQAVAYTFDTSALGLQGWHYTGYGSTPTDKATDPTNLANRSMLAWQATDDADGRSTSGVLKGTVPFQYENDQIDFQAFTQATGKYNWTGYVLTAKVKLVSGGNLKNGCPIQAFLYASQVGYGTSTSAKVDLVLGQWVTVTYDMADALSAGTDITMTTQMGLQMNTGPACVGTTPPDAGVDSPVDAPASTDAADAPASTDAGDGG